MKISSKTNKYCFENAGLDSLEINGCFHYVMLTDQEEKEIKNPDSDYLLTFQSTNSDVPRTEMTKSDSKHMYVRSYCIWSAYIIWNKFKMKKKQNYFLFSGTLVRTVSIHLVHCNKAYNIVDIIWLINLTTWTIIIPCSRIKDRFYWEK